MGGECSVEGCGYPVNARGLCAAHYEQLRRGQGLRPVARRSPPPRPCAFDDCDRLASRAGYCATHYRQLAAPGGLRRIHHKDPDATCGFEGCDRAPVCKGLCRAHYSQQRQGKSLRPLRKLHTPRTADLCVVPGCTRSDVKAHGLCRSHYSQYQRGRQPSALRERAPNGSYDGAACAFPGCARQPVAHGLCDPHYYQARSGLELRAIRPKTYDGMVCSVEGCETRPNSNGLCYRHWMQARRRVTDSIKAERGCADCGCSDPAVLEFHHVDRTTKTDTVGRMTGRSLEQVLAEVEKCDVLCANCHRIRHASPHDRP